MKRFGVLACLAAFLVAIPLSHLGLSDPGKKKKKKPPVKVLICHLPGGMKTGHVIEVSEAAAQTHIDKHGDCFLHKPLKPGDPCKCVIKPPNKCEAACENAFQKCLKACGKDTSCQKRCQGERGKCLLSCKK